MTQQLTHQPQELVEPKAVDEDESKQLWQPAALGEQGADNLRCATTHLSAKATSCPGASLTGLWTSPHAACRSADRKPDEFVFLVVRKADGSWQFPQAAHGAGETIRQARRCVHDAARALARALLKSVSGALHRRQSVL